MEAKVSNPIDEKRAAVRYPVALRVEFEHGSGWTRDVSATGAYIETARAYGWGTPIRFVMSRSDKQGEASRIECRGRVVWTEPVGDVWRLGVAMDAVRFED